MTATINDIKRQADELANSWVLVATNQGTYGSTEAVRVVGSGDPRFADCNVYEQVGTGKRRVDGCDPDECPGCLRRFNGELAKKQARLAELRRQIKASR